MAKKTKRYTNLYVKRRLLKLEIDVFGIISNGLLHHTPKHKMLAQMRKELRLVSVQLGLSDPEINQIWTMLYAQYLEVSRKTFSTLRKIELKFGKKEDYEESLVQRRAVIYSSIRVKIQQNDLIKAANELTYQYEYRMKHNEIFESGGLLDDDSLDSPFFLASSHPKPAKDHADWEGKVYYDEDWEEKGNYSDQDKIAIRAYIRNHKLRSVQWVVGPPVYFVTRRNCRHYLKHLPLDEVLHSSAKKLLKTHKMYMKDEEPVSKDVLVYREYYNRLKVEEALQVLVPNEKLELDIKKDRKLLDKWKQKINNNNRQ